MSENILFLKLYFDPRTLHETSLPGPGCAESLGHQTFTEVQEKAAAREPWIHFTFFAFSREDTELGQGEGEITKTSSPHCASVGSGSGSGVRVRG